MEIRVLKTFLRASQTGSFSKAADELGYSQAAVTLQIKQLEDELGVTLFERIGKRVKLTDKGEAFAEETAKILNNIESAVYRLKDDRQLTGKLTLGVSESVCDVLLPEIAAEFRNKYPLVELQIISGADYTFYEMMRQNQIDLAFIIGGTGNKNEVKTVFRKVLPLVFVASSSNPLTKRKNVSLEEIMSKPLFLTEKDQYSRYDLETVLGEKGLEFDFRPIINATNPTFIVQMLLRSEGISFLPEFVVNKYMTTGEIATIRCDEIRYGTYIRMIHHKNKGFSPQMKAFAEITNSFIKKI